MSIIKNFPEPIIDYDIENIYRPAEDTYLIVDYFKNHIEHDLLDGIPVKKIRKILDMGTGTGYIALFFQILKNNIPDFNPTIYASDILEEAISLSKHNESLNKLNNEIEFIHSDLFANFPNNLKHSFDIIIFNPPYLPSFNSFQPKEKKKNIDNSWNGGTHGFELFTRFLDETIPFIKAELDSRIYYICSSRTDLDKLYKIIKDKGFNNKILEKQHIFFEDIYLNKLKLSSV